MTDVPRPGPSYISGVCVCVCVCVCVQVDLRARDILNLITIAGKWYSAGKPYRGIPTAVGHVSSSLRLVTVHETPSHGLEVLVTRGEGAEGQSRLPVCLLSHGGVVTGLVQRTLKVNIWCTCFPAPETLH